MVLTIYADMLVAVNLYIDFFLLWCVRKVLGLGARTCRLLLGALLGAVWALLSLLPLPAWTALPLGLIGALLAALGAFAPGSAKLLGKAALCLWLFSFLLAGFCLFLLQVLSPAGLAVSGNVIYLDLSPRLLFLFTCGAYGLFWLWHRLLPRDRGWGRLQAFVVEQGGKTQTLLARGDTGNSLREPFSGLPVIVYYIPGVTGMTAGLPQLRTLLEIPGVAGIKMSDWNVFLLHSVCAEYPDKVVYSGFDEMLVPGLLYGADGCIGTWMNLLPDLYAKVYARVRAGELASVLPVMNAFNDFLSMGWKYGILDAFEELMRAKGYADRCFRRPSSWDPGKLPEPVLQEMLRRLERLEEDAARL